MTKMKMKKMKPTIRIVFEHRQFDDVIKTIKTMKLRHSPFLRTWKEYYTDLELTPHQKTLMLLNGNIKIDKYYNED